MAACPRTPPQDIPVGKHGEWGSTGAAPAKRKRIAEGEAAGRINPFKKQLVCAEKQLRQQKRRGGERDNLVFAQLKVQNMVERMEMWEQQQRGEQLDLEKAQKKSIAYFEHKYGSGSSSSRGPAGE